MGSLSIVPSLNVQFRFNFKNPPPEPGSPQNIMAGRKMVQDAEWAAKPCSERWSPKRRPCPFYECGRDCERTWASEAGDLYVVCRAAMLAYLTGVVLYLTYKCTPSSTACFSPFFLLSIYM